MRIVKPKMLKEKVNPKEVLKSYIDKIEDEFIKKGVVFFDPGDYTLNISQEYLSLPPVITEVSSKELGEYLNAFTQQKMYLRTLYGRVELLEEEARRAYLKSSEHLYKKYSESKMSETAKERLINTDSEVEQFYTEYSDCKKRTALLEYNIQNIEDAIFMISREVTRRTGDFNDENRSHNVSRR